MCLLLFAWQAHPDYPLIIAANRDEFHARPTHPAHIWPGTHPALIAGKDLQANGTWLGITANGRFAAVTNYREVPAVASRFSRGQLVTRFLSGNENIQTYAEHIHANGNDYAGFNLLLADLSTAQPNQLYYVSNRHPSVTAIKPGIHGLSNASLNTPWPKVTTGKTQLQQVLKQQPNHQQLRQLLSDEQIADDQLLPTTGVSTTLERVLSARKIVTADYGTRCSTTLLVKHNGHIDFHEQSYAADGQINGNSPIELAY